MDTGKSINEFVKAYMQFVETHHKENALENRPYAMPIAVSREQGSGGAILAAKLAERLDFHFYDKEVLEKIAKRIKVPVSAVTNLDERPSGFLEQFGASFLSGYSVELSEFERHLKLTITGLLRMGNAVILGRGATLIAQPGQALRIRVISPFEHRVQNMVKALAITEQQARAKIRTVEAERQAFHHRFFGKSDLQSESFDLALNTQQLGIDECVELALQAYHYIADTLPTPPPKANVSASSMVHTHA